MELVTLLSQSSWGRNVELSIGSMEPDCKTHSRFLLWLMDERLRQSKLTLESGARSDRSPRIDQHELALQAAGRESIRKWRVIRVEDRRRRSPHEGHLTQASSCSVQLLRTLWPFLSKQLNPRWEFVLSKHYPVILLTWGWCNMKHHHLSVPTGLKLHVHTELWTLFLTDDLDIQCKVSSVKCQRFCIQRSSRPQPKGHGSAALPWQSINEAKH